MNKKPGSKPQTKKPAPAPKRAGKKPVITLPPPEVGYIIKKGL